MDSYDHVACQVDGLEFYIPGLLRYGEYLHGGYYPLLVGDVISNITTSRYVYQNCYNKLFQSSSQCFFWKNHPIDKISVVGYVVGWQWRLIGNDEYYFFKIDDCTIDKTSSTLSLLMCKCSKQTLLNSSIIPRDQTGEKLRLFGTIDLNYCEMNVSYVEFVHGIKDELEHWTLAMELRSKLAVPWKLIDPVIASNSNLQTDAYGETFNQFYIEELQNGSIKAELEIASPYKEHSYIGEEAKFIEGPQQLEEPIVISLESESSQEEHEPKMKLEKFELELLTILLKYKNVNIPYAYVFESQEIRSILKTICSDQQSYIDQLLEDLYKKYVQMGLAKVSNDRSTFQLPLLHSLYTYYKKRVKVLIKLQCLVGRIDHQKNRAHLIFNDLPQNLTIMIMKQAIKDIVKQNESTIINWWIEMNNDGSSMLHLQYS